MLFDLRGRRKRFIQVIYAILALLFTVSFVGFGIGSDAAGGIFDAFGLGSGGTGPDNPQYEERIDAAKADLAEDPEDKAALLELASTYALAGDDEVEVNERTGAPVLTEDAKPHYEQAIEYWERYLETDPRKPEGGIAAQLLNVYVLLAQSATDPAEIEELLDGVYHAAAVVAEDQPSANSLSTMAEFAYLSGREKQGDEAAEQALEEADKSERTQIRRYVEDAEKRGKSLQRQLKDLREAQGTTPEEAFQNPFEDTAGGGLGGGF